MASDFVTSLRRARFLFGTVPLFALATTGLFPIIAVTLGERGFDERSIGLISSIYYLGAVMGAFTYGAFVARYGQRVSIACAAGLAAVATAGLTLFDNQVAWIALRFAGGYALGSYYLVMDRWIGSIASQSSRGRLYAMYETIRLVATALAPLFLIVGTAHSSIIFISAVFLFASGPALFNAETHVTLNNRMELTGLLGIANYFRWPLIIIMCGGLSSSSFYALGAVYAKGMGFSENMIAIFIGVVLLAPALVGFPVGALADRSRRMSVAAGVAVIVTGMAVVLAVGVSGSVWVTVIGAIIVGGGMVTMYALGLSRIVDAVGDGHAIGATTAALLAYNFGAFLGPLITGLIMYQIGHGGLYVSIGLFAIMAFIASMTDLDPTRCCAETPVRAG